MKSLTTISLSKVTLATGFGLALLSAIAGPVLGQTTTANGTPPQALRGHTARSSVNSAGVQSNSSSLRPKISGNGRFVVFESNASNLVAGDTNGNGDVFIRDRVSGVTERVSLDSAGLQGDASSFDPAISADGRFVAFTSEASNLVASDTNGHADVFIRDRLLGTTTLVSVDSFGLQGNDDSGYSSSLSISADGRHVAFQSYATNLVPGDTNLTADMFVRDCVNGTTERVSVDSAGVQAESVSYEPALSADGRYVLFTTYSEHLVPGDTNEHQDVFLHDRVSGTTERVSVGPNGVQGNRGSYHGSISANGRYVAFTSVSNNFLVDGETGLDEDVFLRDRVSGTTTLVSVSYLGGPASGGSAYPTITPDGRFVAFHSAAPNLVRGDRNFNYDVFVRDLLLGTTTLVSTATAGDQGNSTSSEPSISNDGRTVTFSAYASNLVPADTNATVDIFVHNVPKSFFL